MPGRAVSEKTLELNIGAEILWIIRQQPGCEGAFWVGMRQDQEAKNGIDELIANVPAARHLALQFKSPKPTPKDGPFRFTLNGPQHKNLLKLAIVRPNAVLYVLPHYNNFKAMRDAASKPGLRLLAEAYSLRVADIDPWPAAKNKADTHIVFSNQNASPPETWLYSEPAALRLSHPFTLRETIAALVRPPQAADADQLVSQEGLREWLISVHEAEQGDRRRIGQRLRGFSTFCVPEPPTA